MLIASHRFRPGDIETWERLWEQDQALANGKKMIELELRAVDELRRFAQTPCYVGVSWGKDSVVIAHLSYRLGIGPLAWFPAGPIENPDCHLVRDAFLKRFPMQYREIEAAPTTDVTEAFHGHDGAQREFEMVSRTLGHRYVSGVRADESATRKRRMMRFGESSANTCAPIGWWPTEYVFAYLAKYDLPTHPVYAMSLGGVYERNMLRVGTLGGKRGRGNGRREHEMTYYRDEMIRLGLA